MTTKRLSTTNLPHALIYAGSLPFIVGAILLLLDISSLPVLGNVTNLTATYGLVIVTFLNGIHWGQQLSLGFARPSLFISSNIITVGIWLSWLLASPQLFMVLLTLPLVVLLYIDFILRGGNFIAQDYFQSRLIISIAVISSLLVAAAFS
jgi:hypothetical protein